MNRPVNYEQFDKRWAGMMYSNHGDKAQTIKDSGCGPTCAAMVIATLRDKTVTPVITCNWAAAKGFCTYDNGTAWGYFRPQMAAYGIECDNYTTDAAKAVEAIKAGYMVIALALKGLWTSSGHYILAYAIEGDKILINDPFSTAAGREKAPLATFKQQCVKFWIVKEEWQMQKREVTFELVKKDGAVKVLNIKDNYMINEANHPGFREIGENLGYEVGYNADTKRPRLIEK